MQALVTKSLRRPIVLFVALLAIKTASAQLKIGDNPTTINKSSILELESDRQGLLLTRLSDTANINTLSPPDGMIIYLNSDNSLRLRSNGSWKKIAEFSSTKVQEIAAGAVSNTGNPNGISIISLDSLRTIILHAANATNPGIVTAGTQTFGGNKTFQDSVTVNGQLILPTLTANTTSDSVLVYNNGVIEKRTVSAAAFGNAIRSINGNRDTAQKIAFRNTGTDLVVNTNGADSIFLDIPDAGASARGVVSTATQTFAGNKTFQDSVVASKTLKAGSAGTANSTMQVDGSLSMAIKTVSSNYSMTASDNTILASTTSNAITVTLPSAAGISGRVYTIKKIGTGGINNQLTISPSGGATIDNGSSYIIYNDWTYVTLQTDGTNWYIIKR